MKLFLVDHSYGACLVIANDQDEAMNMGDAIGDVHGIYPCNLPLVLGIRREKAADGDEPEGSDLVIEADPTWEFANDLEALLERHRVALDADEFKQMGLDPDGFGSLGAAHAWATTVTIGVQVNGTTVGTIDIEPLASKPAVFAQAVTVAAARLAGKTVTRSIYRPHKLINLVTSSSTSGADGAAE